MTDTFTLVGPVLAPDMTPQSGSRLTFSVVTGTETGAHIPEGEIIGPKIVETDADADFEITLPVPSEMTPDGCVIQCVVKLGRSTWTYVIRNDVSPGTYSFAEVAILAMDEDLEPPGYVPVAGPPGTAATITVGDVTTGPLDITNVGTPNAAVFDFQIPAGSGVLSVGEGTNVSVTGTAQDPVVNVLSVPAEDVLLDAYDPGSGELWPDDSPLQTLFESFVDGLVGTMGVVTSIEEWAGNTVRRVWERGGTSGLVDVAVNATSPALSPPALSVVGSRLRVQGTSGTTRSRSAIAIPGTGTWEDSEIRSIWFGSAGNLTTVQPGHVHRGSATGGLVVDQNVVGPGTTTWAAVWEWDGAGTLNIPESATGAEATRPDYVIPASLKYVNAYNILILEAPSFPGVHLGDLMKISASGNSPINAATWTVGGFAHPGNTIYGNELPALIMSAGTALGSDVAKFQPSYGCVADFAPIGGSGDSSRGVYPMWVASRVVGTKIQVKKWGLHRSEPPWGTFVAPAAQSWELQTTGTIPSSGWCGLLANHLGNYYTEFGDVTCTRLDA